MAKRKAVWTVMVYLAGDNNLTSECLFALTEMKKALPGKHINVVAQFDPRDEYLPTHRYEINRKGANSSLFDDIIDEAHYNPATKEVQFTNESKRAKELAAKRKLRSDEVQTLFGGVQDLSTLSFVEEDTRDDTDTGSPATLYNFLSFCIEAYPAEHYLVTLSGHAGGVETDYLLKDESSKGSLTFNEMKQVFRELRNDLDGRSIDIVGMDNCLMSMGEICYELRDLVDIIVGCESFSPASGWPYRQILERLRKDFADPKPAKKKSIKVKAAKAIVEEYVNYYSPYWMSGMSVSQSALDLRRVEELRQHVDSLGSAMDKELKREFGGRLKNNGRQNKTAFKDKLVLAHWEAQSYNGERFVDLFDFCSCLEERSPSSEIVSKCRELRRFIADDFVLKSCYSGAAYQYSYGVSIYFPWAQVAAKYQNLDFVKNSSGTGWLSFLRTYAQLTRRRPRGAESSNAALTSGNGVGRPSNRMVDDRMVDDRMVDDRMVDDRMVDDRMVDDRMMSTEGNRISSMRNPPVVFLPTDCIRDHKDSRKTLKKFFSARPKS